MTMDAPRPSPVPGVEAETGRSGGLLSPVPRFRTADEGLAAIEFALGLPVLLLILLAGTQVTLYIDASRKVDLIAQSISEMISQVMPPDNRTVAQVDASDLHFSFDAALVLFPYLLQDSTRQGVLWWQNISINYASIEFRPRSASCPDSLDMSACYTPRVVWTSTGTAQPPDGDNFRPCDAEQQPADNAAAPNRFSLPRSVYGPSSLVVIDVVFTFRPTFGSGIVSPVRIARSAYVQPRYASLIDYSTVNTTWIATRCAGN